MKKGVLIVDDSTTVLNIFSRILHNFLGENYYISTAENGLEALSIIQQNPNIILVLTDIVMPIMNGIDLVKSLLNHYNFSNKNIIVFSSASKEKCYEKAFKHLGIDFQKYFNKENLQNHIKFFKMLIYNTLQEIENDNNESKKNIKLQRNENLFCKKKIKEKKNTKIYSFY